MSNNKGEKILWMLAGLGIGAGVALLFAPKSGEETRKYLKHIAKEGRDKVKETKEEVFGKGKEVYERGKAVVDEAMEFVDRGRRAVLR